MIQSLHQNSKNLPVQQTAEAVFLSNLVAADPNFNPANLPPHLQQLFQSLSTGSPVKSNRLKDNNSYLGHQSFKKSQNSPSHNTKVYMILIFEHIA